jgi:hypothetical protein
MWSVWWFSVLRDGDRPAIDISIDAWIDDRYGRWSMAMAMAMAPNPPDNLNFF